MKMRFEGMCMANYEIVDLIEQVQNERKILEDFEIILLDLNNLIDDDQARKEMKMALAKIKNDLGIF